MLTFGVQDIELHVEVGCASRIEQAFLDGVGFDAAASRSKRKAWQRGAVFAKET